MTVSVAVHPQLMLQLSDQFTRRPFLGEPRPPFCVGVLFGTSDGLRIEACSAIEVRIAENRARGAGLRIDITSYRQLARLHEQIYKNENPIGWYACQELSPDMVRTLHALFDALEHSGRFIRGEFLDRPQPLRLFLLQGEDWVPISYTYEAALAERIAMMQLQAEGSAESQVAFTAEAYRSLDRDLEAIEIYLTKVANDELPFDPVLVRKCADVGQWWDHRTPNPDQDKIAEQENLALLVGMVAERIADFAGSRKSSGGS
jgi:hypothetical protein